MDEDLRKFALDLAATSLRGAPFTEIVQAAEAYHAFLAGKTMTATDENGARGGLTGVISNHDLGQAEQSPAFVVVSGQPGDPNIYGYVERDQDNIPTRLVRVPVASPE